MTASLDYWWCILRFVLITVFHCWILTLSSSSLWGVWFNQKFAPPPFPSPHRETVVVQVNTAICCDNLNGVHNIHMWHICIKLQSDLVWHYVTLDCWDITSHYVAETVWHYIKLHSAEMVGNKCASRVNRRHRLQAGTFQKQHRHKVDLIELH